jgi:16S rRNA (uracil1498-N3)-methyltransferase
MIRLFVPEQLAAESQVTLSAGQAHYLRDVMRRAVGDEVALFNGRDGEWLGLIDTIGRKGVRVTPARRLREQTASVDLELVVALIKRARLEAIVEKATELGVSRIRLVITRFTQAERTNVDRLTAIAVKAAEQTGRLGVPEIVAPAKLGAILQEWPGDRRLIFCDEAGEAAPMLVTLLPLGGEGGPRSGSDEGSLRTLRLGGRKQIIDGSATPHPSASPPPSPPRGRRNGQGAVACSILIGPEGGFAPEERVQIRALATVIPVSLGPRILRADTAAIAALSLWQAALGDWRP